MTDPKEILRFYDINPVAYSIQPLGTGLIHKTYAMLNGFNEPAFVLQEVNTHVFTRPMDIAHNLQTLERYRLRVRPDFLLPVPMPAADGQPMVVSEGQYYRLTSFVHGASAYDRCEGPDLAYQAALQFGSFTAAFSGLSMDMLRYTIPGFHNLPLRLQQFQQIDRLEPAQDDSAARDRWLGSSLLREKMRLQFPIADRYEQLLQKEILKKRVTHHDTKISNVLFNDAGKGVCVIDLDTVMPGYFISDVGDMMRTYLSPATEEETDLDKIFVRPEIYQAIQEGYMCAMSSALTEPEKACFSFAGEYMIFMQALRFLTDYLQMDRYYGQTYEGQNFIRAANQLDLLEKYQKLLREQ